MKKKSTFKTDVSFFHVHNKIENNNYQTPGTRDCAHGVHIIGQGIGYDSRPTPVVTALTGVGLVGIEGTRIGLLS
jgi:hypothetical protein